MATEPGQRRLAIILHSGAYNRLHQAFSIVQAAVANDMEVHIYFTYWALEKLVKGELDKITLDAEQESGAAKFQEGLRRGVINSIGKMLEESRSVGQVKCYACSQSMGLFGLSEEEVLKKVDKIMGYVAFLAIAEDAGIVMNF